MRQLFSNEFFAALTAAALFPCFAAGHVLWFRRRRADAQGYSSLPAAFLLYAAVWTAVYALPGPSGVSLSEWAAGLATVGFFCLGYMQVFSLTCRGFSLRILVELDKHGSLDLDGIAREYSDGRGMDWLQEKRLESMRSLDLIGRDGEALVLRPRGALAGRIGLLVKAVLGIGPGG